MIVLVPVTDLAGYENIYEESQLIIPITKPTYNEDNLSKDGSMDTAEVGFQTDSSNSASDWLMAERWLRASST